MYDAVLDREFCAYHEAGHVVMALFHGWQVSPEGVEIDERWYTGLRPSPQNALEGPEITISLAGWLAECKRRGQKCSDSDDLLLYIMEVVREEGAYQAEEAEGDSGDAFRYLIHLHPNATDQELISLYRRYEAETQALLERADLWSKVERVAAELITRGKISAMEAHRLADYPAPKLPAPPG